jgi:hypothetical protein
MQFKVNFAINNLEILNKNKKIALVEKNIKIITFWVTRDIITPYSYYEQSPMDSQEEQNISNILNAQFANRNLAIQCESHGLCEREDMPYINTQLQIRLIPLQFKSNIKNL